MTKLRFNTYIAILFVIVFLLLMTALSYADDQKTKEKKEAINSYLGDNNTPRARFTRESENYKVWHTIEQLNRKDEQQRLIDRNIIINQQGKKIKL
jgi:hypothetical protein